MTGPKALVACSDSQLRMNCFDRVTALGIRADAVGDQRGFDRRTEKDQYTIILHDGVLDIPEDSAKHLLLLEAETELDDAWAEQVRKLLDVPVRDLEEEDDLENPPPPWLKNSNRGW